MRKHLTRRNFLKLSGGALIATAGSFGVSNYLKKTVQPSQYSIGSLADLPPGPLCGGAGAQSAEALLTDLAQAAGPLPDLFFAGTDGWISLPNTPMPPFHPDDLAPPPFNTYMFGFANLSGLDSGQVLSQKMKAQHQAPLFWLEESQPFRVRLTNLGLAMRPDLVDTHTIHWHGRRNVVPFFDGEPTTSTSVPIGRYFTYIFTVHEPGTYMYHCHVEDVEHVHMGMTGLVFVNPVQNGTSLGGFTKFVYNDGDGSTGYDRQFPMFMSEVWAEAHWADSHIQLPEWSDYRADFNLLNGRVYPDTLASNAASLDPSDPARLANGDIASPPGRPDLQYQPYSALVQANAGERVLLRFANLGFKRQSMRLAGIPMKVVGKDATHLRGRDGTDLTYMTDTIGIGAGESYDVIFTAPPHSGGTGPDTYLLYNRNINRAVNGPGGGYGGQMTEVRIYPAGTLGLQMMPNEHV